MSKIAQTDAEYNKNLEENFLKHIGYEYAGQLCDELDKDKDEWMDFSTPESLDLWFKDFMLKLQKQRKRTIRRARSVKYLKRAAVFIILMVIVNHVLFTSVEAYRVRFLNTITTFHDRFNQVEVVERSTLDASNIPKDWEGNYYPTYIPEGYKLVDERNRNNLTLLIYKDAADNRIVFNEFGAGTSIQYDNERSTIRDIVINKDDKATFVENDSMNIIYWLKDDVLFFIETPDIGMKEIVKIAESLELKK